MDTASLKDSESPSGGPHNKDYTILESILGSPYFGKDGNVLGSMFPNQLLSIPQPLMNAWPWHCVQTVGRPAPATAATKRAAQPLILKPGGSS